MAEGDLAYVLVNIEGDLDGCVTGAARYILTEGDGHTTTNIGIENAAGIYEVHHPDADWEGVHLLNNWTGSVDLRANQAMTSTTRNWTGHRFFFRLATTDEPSFTDNTLMGSNQSVRTLVRNLEIDTYNALFLTGDNKFEILDAYENDTNQFMLGVNIQDDDDIGEGMQALYQSFQAHICPDSGVDPYDRLSIIQFDNSLLTNDQADDLLALGAQEQGSTYTPSGEEDLGSLYFGAGYTGGRLGKGLGKGYVARW